MDVYIPKAGAFLHGGAWNMVYKRDIETLTIPFAKLGYITIGMNLRYVDNTTTYKDELEIKFVGPSDFYNENRIESILS